MTLLKKIQIIVNKSKKKTKFLIKIKISFIKVKKQNLNQTIRILMILLLLQINIIILNKKILKMISMNSIIFRMYFQIKKILSLKQITQRISIINKKFQVLYKKKIQMIILKNLGYVNLIFDIFFMFHLCLFDFVCLF